MNGRNKVMLSDIPKLCLLVATLAFGLTEAIIACERGRTWWHRESGACINCTVCDPQHLAVKYPCDLHSDTVCQPLYDVHIYPFNTPKDSDSEQFSDYYYDYSDYGDVSEDGLKWDLQATSLTLAACGCAVFFVVVLYFSLHHSKQWKAMKLALRSDVQDMSAKLKLMEAGDTPAEPVIPVDHHIYCNIHVAKDAMLGPASAKKGSGNVYTQEKHPS